MDAFSIDKTQPVTGVTGQPAPAGETSFTFPQPRPTAPLGAQPPAEAKPSASPAAFRNIHLRFKIDPHSHEVTVLMIDTTTRRVIRTIPADQLRQLAEGELVELLA
jgi:hypothetical protein